MPGLSLRKLKQAVEEERDACIKIGKGWAGVCKDQTQASLEEEKTRWAALASNTIRSLRGMVHRRCMVLHWGFVYVKLLRAVERTKGSTGTEMHFLNQGFP